MNILIINGPNLNMLGKRNPTIYGSDTLSDIEAMCNNCAEKHYASVDFRQSNHEGEIVDWIQDSINRFDAILINAGAYTHTSIAIHDALELFTGPIVEVHISEPNKREAFRHVSFIEPCATHRVAGHGAKGYEMALEWLFNQKQN